MKGRMRWALAAAGLFAACAAADDPSDTHSHGGDAHSHVEGDATESATIWNGEVELFLEHPVPRAGQVTEFAAHLTRLRDFQPVEDGTLLFQFSRAGGDPKIVTVGRPQQTGLFVFGVTLDAAGDYAVRIEILADDFEATLSHRLEVWAPGQEVPASKAQEAITYRKEQQWALPFSTGVAAPAELEETLRAAAMVIPDAGRETAVPATLAGRFLPPPSGATRIGRRVRRGQLLGTIELLPTEAAAMTESRLSAERSLADVSDQVIRGRSEVAALRAALELAESEHGRVTRLVAAGALPEKRRESAAAELETRRSALAAAEASLSHHLERRRRLEDVSAAPPSSERSLALKAPISGTVVEAGAVPGAYVDAADLICRIVNLDRVWIRGQVYERDAGRLAEISGATLELPDGGRLELAPEQLVAVGRQLSPETRMLPITWEVANRDHRLTLGTAATLALHLGRKQAALAVPREAVLLEDSREVVYVQTGGESFERRIVRTGIRDRDLVELLSGVQAGERVVVEGAYDVALAARSTETADHGHVH